MKQTGGGMKLLELNRARSVAIHDQNVIHTRIEKTPAAALALARDLADPEGSILVTGSFYMVAEIRNLLVLSPARG